MTEASALVYLLPAKALLCRVTWAKIQERRSQVKGEDYEE